MKRKGNSHINWAYLAPEPPFLLSFFIANCLYHHLDLKKKFTRCCLFVSFSRLNAAVQEGCWQGGLGVELKYETCVWIGITSFVFIHSKFLLREEGRKEIWGSKKSFFKRISFIFLNQLWMCHKLFLRHISLRSLSTMLKEKCEA